MLTILSLLYITSTSISAQLICAEVPLPAAGIHTVSNCLLYWSKEGTCCGCEPDPRPRDPQDPTCQITDLEEAPICVQIPCGPTTTNQPGSSSPIACAPHQTEIFYEDADNVANDWTIDGPIVDTRKPGGYFYESQSDPPLYWNSYEEDWHNLTDYCYSGDCLEMYVRTEYLSTEEVTTLPRWVSNPGLISTLGYENITIKYALGMTKANGDVGEICGTSYTVNNGTNWTVIDYQTLNTPEAINWTVIDVSLGRDASDSETIQIRWEMLYNWLSNGSVEMRCFIDEIKLCGTPLPSPISCAPHQTEIFYEDAESITQDWIAVDNPDPVPGWMQDALMYYYALNPNLYGYFYSHQMSDYMAKDTDVCYYGDCLQFGFQGHIYDWDATPVTLPHWVSKPGLISTVGYENVSIVYAVHSSTYQGYINGNCGTSYTVNNGTNWTVINNLYHSDRNWTVIRASLGDDVSDTTFQLGWEMSYSYPNTTTAKPNTDFWIQCMIDEIRLCGTPLPSPISCQEHETEIFYEDVDSMVDDWIAVDNPQTVPEGYPYWLYYSPVNESLAVAYFSAYEQYDYHGNIDDCYFGDCLTTYMFGSIYDPNPITLPHLVSKPGLISTVGYENINIVYAVSSANSGFADVSCATSYTVNNGTDWAVINNFYHSAPYVYQKLTYLNWTIIRALLGDDASNTDTLQLEWEMSFSWDPNANATTTQPPLEPFPGRGNTDFSVVCHIDEIKLCATPIPEPTTPISCAEHETEIFYEDADNVTNDWIADRDLSASLPTGMLPSWILSFYSWNDQSGGEGGGEGYEGYGPFGNMIFYSNEPGDRDDGYQDYYCYFGDCLQMGFQGAYYQPVPDRTLPHYISKPGLVSTVGYENINIKYAIGLMNEGYSDQQCGMSYTVNNGTNWTVIDYRTENANLTEGMEPGPKGAIGTINWNVIEETLGQNAWNSETIQFSFDMSSDWDNVTSAGNLVAMRCSIDEIKVCGTPIQASSPISCEEHETEIFYEDADSISGDWITEYGATDLPQGVLPPWWLSFYMWNDQSGEGGAPEGLGNLLFYAEEPGDYDYYNPGVYKQDYFCYFGDCLQMSFQGEYYQPVPDRTLPNLISKPGLVSTVGYENINIKYAIGLMNQGYSDQQCGMSYTVNNGTNWTVIDYRGASANLTEGMNEGHMGPVEPGTGMINWNIIQEMLGNDAWNSDNIQFSFDMRSHWDNVTAGGNYVSMNCVVDEIKVCGTPMGTPIVTTPQPSGQPTAAPNYSPVTCDPSQSEIFYEDADAISNDWLNDYPLPNWWRAFPDFLSFNYWDDGNGTEGSEGPGGAYGNMQFYAMEPGDFYSSGYYGYSDSPCHYGDCVHMSFQGHYLNPIQDITLPIFISRPGLISTVGYENITVKYAIGLQNTGFVDEQCGMSYTVNNGTNWTAIDYQMAKNPGNLNLSEAVRWHRNWGYSLDGREAVTWTIVEETLGPDAEDSSTLQFSFEMISHWDSVNAAGNEFILSCFMDEIKVCGDPLPTASPTTASPTTAEPSADPTDMPITAEPTTSEPTTSEPTAAPNYTPINCPYGTEIFYEDADSVGNDWTIDNPNMQEMYPGFYSYNYGKRLQFSTFEAEVLGGVVGNGKDYTPLCYYGDCLEMFLDGEVDNTTEVPLPKWISNPGLISTVGYENVSIIYAISVTNDAVENEELCGTSYTINDGMNWTAIHYAPANTESIGYHNTSSNWTVIEAPLGPDASDSDSLQLRWEMLYSFVNPNRRRMAMQCRIDEIKLCGVEMGTSSPTADPTDMPTLDPTRDPTQEPTESPSAAPSQPTDNPTTDPTHEPTADPSENPTFSPSFAPTESPFALKKYKKFFRIRYLLKFLQSEEVEILSRFISKVQEKLLFFIEESYVETIAGSMYDDLFELQIRNIQGEDVEDISEDSEAKFLRYRNELYMDCFIRCEPEEIENCQNLLFESEDMSGVKQEFEQRTTDKLRQYFDGWKVQLWGALNVNAASDASILEFVIDSESALELLYPPGPSAKEWLSINPILIIFVLIMSGMSAMSIFANCHAKLEQSRMDEVLWNAFLFVGLQICVMIADINLCFEICSHDRFITDDRIKTVGICAIAFLIIPYCVNLLFGSQITSLIVKDNEPAIGFFNERNIFFMSLIGFCGGCYDVLVLLSSGNFGFDIFCSGLTNYELHKMNKIKMIANICCQNIPQIAIQSVYASSIHSLTVNTVFAMFFSVASVMSIFWTPQTLKKKSKLSCKKGAHEMKEILIPITYYIEIKALKEIDSLNEDTSDKYLKKKGKTHRISEILTEALNMNPKHIEISRNAKIFFTVIFLKRDQSGNKSEEQCTVSGTGVRLYAMHFVHKNETMTNVINGYKHKQELLKSEFKKHFNLSNDCVIIFRNANGSFTIGLDENLNKALITDSKYVCEESEGSDAGSDSQREGNGGTTQNNTTNSEDYPFVDRNRKETPKKMETHLEMQVIIPKESKPILDESDSELDSELDFAV